MEFVQPIKDQKNIEEMRSYLESKSARDALLFTFGINSVLRITELLKLKVSDVIDENGFVKDHYEIREPAAEARAHYPLGKNVKKAIKDYLKDYKGNLDRPLFPSRKGNKAISRQQAWHILNDAARQTGVTERIGNHSLRKTFVYHAYKNGADLSLLQEMLNHSSTKATLRYIGISPEEKHGISIELNL